MGFKDELPLEERKAEAERIKSEFKDRLPVILEHADVNKHKASSNVNQIDNLSKRKYLVPKEITVGQFIWIVRRRLSLPPEKAIFFLIQNTIPSTSAVMKQVYDDLKDEDGFLYVNYKNENTFG